MRANFCFGLGLGKAPRASSRDVVRGARKLHFLLLENLLEWLRFEHSPSRATLVLLADLEQWIPTTQHWHVVLLRRLSFTKLPFSGSVLLSLLSKKVPVVLWVGADELIGQVVVVLIAD